MKKLFVMLGVLGVLLLGAVLLWFKGKPVTPSQNPLGSIDVGTIQTIMLENQTSSMTFQNREGVWTLILPVEDEVEPTAIDRLVTGLKAFSIGSIVSENPNNYSRFDLVSDKATRVRVFVKGNEKAVLDGYVGKSAANPGDSFFRVEGNPAVFVANELPSYLFKREVRDFRFPKIFKSDPGQADAIEIKFDSKIWNLVRSSDTWTMSGLKKEHSSGQIKSLVEKLTVWFSAEFGSLKGNPSSLGMEKNHLEIVIHSGATTNRVVVNSMLIPDPTRRYSVDMRPITADDRKYGMLILAKIVDDFTNELKTFK